MSEEANDLLTAKFNELSFNFAVQMSEESPRGSILVGCAKVEEYLSKVVVSIFPNQSNSYVKRLTKYPGPVSSFSANIELAYAFRIIDIRIYNCLNSLRKVRNKAAHSSETFSIIEFENDLEGIYQLNDDHPKWVHKLASQNMLEWKLIQLTENAHKEGIDEEKVKALWEENLKKEETKKSLAVQLISWKLYYGLSLLCLHLDNLETQMKPYLSEESTWLSCLKKMPNK